MKASPLGAALRQCSADRVLRILDVLPLSCLIREYGKPLVAGGHPCKLRTSFWIVPGAKQRPDLISQLSVLCGLSRSMGCHEVKPTGRRGLGQSSAGPAPNEKAARSKRFSSTAQLTTEWSGTQDTQHGLFNRCLLAANLAPNGRNERSGHRRQGFSIRPRACARALLNYTSAARALSTHSGSVNYKFGLALGRARLGSSVCIRLF